MFIKYRYFLLLFGLFFLHSCSSEKNLSNSRKVLPPPGVGPKIRSSSNDAKKVESSQNQISAEQILHKEEDLIFTDPDDPESGIPQFETIPQPVTQKIWMSSETQARQLALREGKPILIWFTDSARSPLCKALESDLFSDESFGKWASDHLIRLKIDSQISFNDEQLSLGDKSNIESQRRDYVKNLKKRYRILGHPSLLLIHANGETLFRYRGYKRGDKDYVWGLLKQGVASAEVAHQTWSKQMEQKGYRFWTGKNQQKVFAKLISFSQGNLILIEPNGTRFQTQEKLLSQEDKAWITETNHSWNH